MALLDAYANAAEYRARVGKVSIAEDATILTLLTSVSRVVEKRLGVMVGAFNTHSGVYVFDGTGRSLLRLRDRAGRQYFLTAITADSLKIDSDLDGSYDDYTLDLSDAWVRGLPENAAAGSEPYTAIELRPLTSATITTFPNLPGCVQITGTFGWAAVPGAIKDRVVGITRELIDVQHAGAAMLVSDVEGEIDRVPAARALMSLLEREYSHRLPAFA